MLKLQLLILMSTVLLHGCGVLQQLPSMQHCDKVSYVRDKLDIEITAHCTAPIGGLPLGQL